MGYPVWEFMGLNKFPMTNLAKSSLACGQTI
jgi:hypothetical protein